MLKSNFYSYIFNVVCVLVIVLFGVLSTLDLANYLDIFFADEANYMYRGIHFFDLYIEPENGPVYSFWYFILSKFESNPINLYYFNWKITLILPAILFFITLRTYNINVFISTLFSLFLLYSTLNYTNWPRVSNFCISIILISIIVFKQSNNRFKRLFYCSCIALIASYIRPEFFLSFIFLVIFLMINIFLEKMTKTVFLYLTSFAIFLVAIKIFYGLPMFEKDSSRSVIAFAQYFTLNKFIINGVWTEDPWSNWEKHFYPVFGNAKSIFEIVRNNPKSFFEQINYNFIVLLKKIYFSVSDFLTPKWFFNLKIVLGVPFIMFLIIIIYNFNKIKLKINLVDLKIIFFESIPYIGFLIPIIISCIILFPREHYFYMFNILFVCVFIIIVNFLVKNKNITISKLYFVMLIFFSSFYILVLNIQPEHYYGQTQNTPKKNTYEFILKFKVKNEINILENEGGISVFLGDNYKWIPGWVKNEDFNTFLEKHGINFVWVTDLLLNDPRLKTDIYFQDFILNYKKYNFKKIENSSILGYLLVSETLEI